MPMRAFIQFAAFCLVLASAPSFARQGDELGQSCAIDWTQELAGRTIFGLDLIDGSRFTEYLTANGRAIWTMDGLDQIQDDQWSIKQCDQLCWDLNNFDDWCARLIQTDYGMDVYDLETGEKLFQVIISGQGDQASLERRLLQQSSI